jgi:SAM-dependent methyltransferase
MSAQGPEPVKATVVAGAAGRICPGCAGATAKPLGTKAAYALRCCASCGTIYTETPPESGALDELYDHYYDHQRFEIPRVVAASLDRLVRSFTKFRETNRWLDVGYGAGGLLTIAERHGWLCHGIEVSPAALRFGAQRGWVVAAAPEEALFPEGGFDVVTMIELIEHVTTPDAFLASAARWLRPGGLLYLTTPNANSLNRRILGLEWSVLSPPEHQTIWSPRGIRHALVRSGFVPRGVRTEGLNPSELRARVGSSRVGSPRAGIPPLSRNDAALALNEAFSRSRFRRGLKMAVNWGLSALRVGDTLKVWAVRGPDSCTR